jgi:hypothetical protein
MKRFSTPAAAIRGGYAPATEDIRISTNAKIIDSIAQNMSRCTSAFVAGSNRIQFFRIASQIQKVKY